MSKIILYTQVWRRFLPRYRKNVLSQLFEEYICTSVYNARRSHHGSSARIAPRLVSHQGRRRRRLDGNVGAGAVKLFPFTRSVRGPLGVRVRFMGT